MHPTDPPVQQQRISLSGALDGADSSQNRIPRPDYWHFSSGTSGAGHCRHRSAVKGALTRAHRNTAQCHRKSNVNVARPPLAFHLRPRSVALCPSPFPAIRPTPSIPQRPSTALRGGQPTWEQVRGCPPLMLQPTPCLDAPLSHERSPQPLHLVAVHSRRLARHVQRLHHHKRYACHPLAAHAHEECPEATGEGQGYSEMVNGTMVQLFVFVSQ